jgi:hypothetical protein
MPEDQETGFTFVDKRRGSDNGEDGADTTGPESPTSSEERASAPEDGGGASAGPFQVPHLSATDRIAFCINWLSEGAWISLGLVRDPATEKIEQDLAGARTLIDAIAYLAEKAEAGVDEAAKRELQTLVRDLRLNFVQQQNRAQ